MFKRSSNFELGTAIQGAPKKTSITDVFFWYT